MDSLYWDSIIHGHHVYKEIWDNFYVATPVDEVHCVEHETYHHLVHYVQDCFTSAVVKGQITL